MTDHDDDARDDERFMHRVALLMVGALAAAGASGVALMTFADWVVAL
jgi:hypothetical protein